MSQLPSCLSVAMSYTHCYTHAPNCSVQFVLNRINRQGFLFLFFLSCLLSSLFNFLFFCTSNLYYLQRLFIRRNVQVPACAGCTFPATVPPHFFFPFQLGNFQVPLTPFALLSSIPLVISHGFLLLVFSVCVCVCARIRVVVVVHLSPLSTRVFDVFLYAYRPNSSLFSHPVRYWNRVAVDGWTERFCFFFPPFFSLLFFIFFLFRLHLLLSIYTK